MPPISAYLGDDHRRCDDLFVEAERLAAGHAAGAQDAFDVFCGALAHHFAMEEEILFPAYDTASGYSSGPTAVMRYEHGQMRELLGSMRAALARGDDGDFLDLAESLLILMQQHNAKEEQILYPMMDRMLPDSAGLIKAMEGFAHGGRAG